MAPLMKLLHRHLLSELFRNAALVLLVLHALYFVLALTFTLGSARSQGVPMLAILSYVAFEVLSNLHLILPMTVLSAVLFGYGRFSADGEWTAARSSGISPYQILLPALFLGALGAGSLAWLQDGVVPNAKHQGRVALRAGLLRNLDTILTHSDRKITERRWKADWEAWTEDEEGRLVLLDLNLVELAKNGEVKTRTQARFARCVVDERNHQIHLDLKDVARNERKRPALRFGSFRLTLDLDALSSRHFVNRRRSSLSYEELLTRSALGKLRSKLIPPGKTRRKALKRYQKMYVEYHMRVSFAFAPFFFALLGAGLGLWKPMGNRALVFLSGFLLMMGIHFPLVRLGQHLSVAGTLPPQVGLWIGNVVIGALGLFFIGRAIKR